MNNLIRNAVDASRDRGLVTVSTRPVSDSTRQVEIEIRDRGDGMTPQVIDKIFQPYFTTKSKGTGLGMAIVRKIVDDHDGTIRIESKPGEGTGVFVRI